MAKKNKSKDKLKSADKNFESNAKTSNNQPKESANNFSESYQKALNNMKTVYEERLAEEKEILEEEYRNKTDELIQATDRAKSKLQDEYDKKFEELELRYIEKEKALTKNVADRELELEEKLADIERKKDLIKAEREKMLDEIEIERANMLEELELQYKEKENAFANRESELEEKLTEFNQRENELLKRTEEFEKDIERKKDLIKSEREKMLDEIEVERANMIKEMQADEEMIRREHNLVLKSEWDEEYRQLQDAAYSEIENIYEQAREDRDKAAKERIEAEKDRSNAVAAALSEFQAEMNKNNYEYQAKLHQLTDRELELNANRQSLELDRENLEIEKEIVKDLKEQLNQFKEKFSPAVVAKLEANIELLKMQNESLRENNRELLKENDSLKQFVENDDGRSIASLLDEIENLRSDNLTLRDRLADLPPEYELNEMRGLSEKLDVMQANLNREQQRRLEVERQLSASITNAMEFEQLKKINETLRILNSQLQEEITRNNEFYKQQKTNRFPALVDIDKRLETEEKSFGNFAYTDTDKTLEQIVTYVRNYGATNGDGKNKLFYSAATIRAFIASMASTGLIILQGLSGTGKSSLPRLFKQALGFESIFISVQSSWRDNRELLGYDNDFTKKFKETEFTKEIYAAGSPINSDRVFLIVLDEMNLSRVEYYFADFLSVLEKPRDEWLINLIEYNNEAEPPKYLVNGTQLKVTPNIWFIGTANRDESTQGITDKVYDRAQILDFTNRNDDFSADRPTQIHLSYSQFRKLLDDAIENTNYQMDKSDWEKVAYLDETMKESLDITFGNRIEEQMKKFVSVYVACGGTKNDAIDYMLNYKVLRKLENRFEPFIVQGLAELESAINLQFGNSPFNASRNFIRKKTERLGSFS